MNLILINKLVGETPLEALERYRVTQPDMKNTPMTYAGRLDPMAEGILLILVGDECKNKAAYLGLDKEYEVEVVFGITTDTYDALGLAKLAIIPEGSGSPPAQFGEVATFSPLLKSGWEDKYVGKFKQEYPPYSSKTVGGKQLHELARAGELPDEMPTKEVEIYSIETVGTILKYSGDELRRLILERIALVKGDFRQKEIVKRWDEVLSKPALFNAIKIRVKCSSGTYMRALADRVGKDLGVSAFALSINRTSIYLCE